MTEFVLHDNQKPSDETLKRMSELKDEDIVFDKDCSKMTPKIEEALARTAAERNRPQKASDD